MQWRIWDFQWGVRRPPTWAFLQKMYVKRKEFGPMGGHVLGTPPGSANGMFKM